ncbi:hypothetical protein FOCC_FOCC007614, partial [Frankliniella occidentalis]
VAATPPTQYTDDSEEYDDDADEAAVVDAKGVTSLPEDHPSHNEVSDVEEDILYQQGAVMSASLQDNATGGLDGKKVEVAEATGDGQRRANGTSYVVVPRPTPRPGPASTSAPVASTPRAPEPPKVRFVPVSEALEQPEPPAPVDACPMDCGPGGVCVLDADEDADGRRTQRCQCPLGRGGSQCQDDVSLRYPRFSGRGWLAFPALRAAYKKVSMHVEFRPEAWDGVLLLAGERDDLTGDYLAVVLSKGFVEFRYERLPVLKSHALHGIP